ncbi:MAG: uracil-DNA glycosylase [Gemmataceae bacterium]
MTPERLPKDWRVLLQPEFDQPYFHQLRDFVAEQRATHNVYPPEAEVFQAFTATPFERVKVVLLGQDPYHGPGQAHGMCFSVRPGITPPPSLGNMFKELQADQGCPPPASGYLLPWAEAGVLLLNTVLTVRAGTPKSHQKRGWETFTDRVIDLLNQRDKPLVFALWGGEAQKKAKRIDDTRHRICPAAHPSPLSAAKFIGSKPYSAIDDALTELGEAPIPWCLS